MGQDSQEMVKKVFNQKSARVETNKGEEYYNSLFDKMKSRLDSLRKSPKLSNISTMDVIETEGIDFVDLKRTD